MNSRLIALGVLLVGFLATPAPSHAQAPVLPYYQIYPKGLTAPPGEQPVDLTHPLPVTLTPLASILTASVWPTMRPKS